MTKDICNICERSQRVSKYYPCQVPKVERLSNVCVAKERLQQYTYLPREKNKTEEKSKGAAKINDYINKAKRELEEACGMFGWDEHDEIDSVLHAKNFLRACINVDNLDAYDSQYNFGDVIFLIKENKYLKNAEEEDKVSPVKRVKELIEAYVKRVENKELNGLSGYNIVNYAKTITARIEKFIL
jgi:hypothetical protein